MRNMAVLHSPAFSYPLPVLVRVLSNLLIFKGKILYYNKDIELHVYPYPQKKKMKTENYHKFIYGNIVPMKKLAGVLCEYKRTHIKNR